MANCEMSERKISSRFFFEKVKKNLVITNNCCTFVIETKSITTMNIIKERALITELNQKINEYCNKLKVRNPITLTNFKKKIKLWCDIRGYKFNPEFWFNNLSPSDQIRG